MSEEISLSLEETNKLRISLGLKPIPLEDGAGTGGETAVEDQPSPQNSVDTAVNRDSAHFIEDDRVQLLRKRISRLRGTLQSNKEESSVEAKDWLDQIGKKKTRKPLKLNYDNDEEDDDLPLLRVSHDISQVNSGKDMILTLKENDIHGEEEDVLENENHVQDRKDAKRVELRQMNRDRKRMRKKIQVSSADIAAVDSAAEQDGKGSVLLIGAQTSMPDDGKPSATPEDYKDKVKVVFDASDSDEPEATDYKPVAIKRRKVNKANSRNKITLPSRREAVKFEDEEDDGDELFVPAVSTVRAGPKPATPEEMALAIKREKLEREQRVSAVTGNSGGLLIDEKSTILDSLEAIASDGDETKESVQNLKPSAFSKHAETEPEAPDSSSGADNRPDFYTGLASTLNFLQDKNLLQAVKGTSTTPSRFNHNKEIQEVRQQIEQKARIDHASYTAKELEEIKKFEDEQVARHVNILQKQRLQDYNPDVQLVYKDEKGNELTTKEAYKRISQKFHGTKSNKKKLEKAQAKIEARNRLGNEPNVFDIM